MANDLKIINEIGVEYQPSILKLNNKDELIKMAKEIADRYKKTVITADTINDDKTIYQSINNLYKAVNSQRIDIKNKFNEPYNQFKSDVDDVLNELNLVLKPMKKQIDDIHEQERQERLNNVKELIERLATSYDLDPSLIEIQKSWTNKGMTKNKLTKIIDDEFKQIKTENDLKQKNFEISKFNIEERCKQYGFDSAPWVQLLNSMDVMEVIQAVDDQHNLLQKHKEYEKAQSVVSQWDEQTPPKQVDVNGEIIDEKTDMVHVQIEITSTMEDMNKLTEFLAFNGYEWHEKYEKI